jgi:uroporphyrinogen decarboxylase
MDMYDDEEYVKKLIAHATDAAIAVADLYIDAGMDVIGAVDPSGFSDISRYVYPVYGP